MSTPSNRCLTSDCRVSCPGNVRFLDVPPLKFFDHTVDIKQRITHYLDT